MKDDKNKVTDKAGEIAKNIWSAHTARQLMRPRAGWKKPASNPQSCFASWSRPALRWKKRRATRYRPARQRAVL